MEPGSYITNTILINPITSIPYAYLEPKPSNPASSLASLRRIEASWRGKGALVVCDPSKFGLWIFGSGDDPYAKLSSSCVIDRDGGIETQGMKFIAETRGTFETSALKSPDIFQAQGPSKTPSTMNSISHEAVRNAQIMNARAAQINNAASMRQGQLPSPVNATGSNPEASDSTAKIVLLFLSAVLGSASYLLCHNHGLIPMNARTLTRPSRRNMKDVVSSMSYECPRLSVPMITLDVALTPLGSLTLKATCQASSALSFVTITKENEAVKASIYAGELVLLAPGAIMARYLGPCTEESVMNLGASSRSGQNTSLQPENWQHHCRKWLVDMGVDSSLLQNCTWLMVQISSPTFANQSGPKPRNTSNLGLEPLTFPWPADLCFVRHKVAYECSGKIRTTMTNDMMDQDPLVFAEQWFSTKTERDADISRRKQHRDAESAAKIQAEIQARVVACATYSPLVARRNSTVGVYPTPPDGVQIMPGATPNFDGTSSTPGNVNQPTPMNVDPSLPTKDDTSNDPWSSTNTQKERQGSEFPTNDEGDLFGEITNDLFGENDITDADFNFFDEPDTMLDVIEDFADNAVASEVEQLPTVDQHQERDIRANAMIGADEETLADKTTDIEMSLDSPVDKIQTVALSGSFKTVDPQRKHHLHQQSITVEENHDIAATLSPELVFRRLFPEPGSGKKAADNSFKSSRHRRFSQFGTIGFESAVSAVNDKYSSNGRFGYVDKSELTLQPSSTTIPETRYLNMRHKRHKKALPISIITSPSSPAMLQIETSSTAVGPVDNKDDIDPNSGTGSDLSDPDDLSPISEEPPKGFVVGVKRKREIHDEGDYEITSSFQDLAVENTTPVGIEESMPTALDCDPADWPLNEFLSLPQPPMTYELVLTDNEYIAAAQILTDQLASSTLPISSLIKDAASPLSADFLEEKTIVNKAQTDLATVAKMCFHNVEACNLNKFLSIQGIPSINQIMRTSARPQVRDGLMQLQDNPFTLKTPYLEVRRSDSKLTVLPSAITFWDNLGLGPCKGNKDIRTVCIFPDGEAMPHNADIFLERMRGAYESGKLGSHDRIASHELGFEQDLEPGLVSIPLPSVKKDQVLDLPFILATFKRSCVRLGKALASISGEERNLVVYFIYPSDHEEILPLMCAAFYDLYDTYKWALNDSRTKIRNELVLQLIPKQFVASSTAIVIPSPVDYARLALEVYDRCADFQSSSCSPSILLEQPLPERIDFKLTANPSVSLLDENSCIHVAYAQSIDDRWISAAWTDNRGAEQMTASYCLGRKNRPISRTVSEIAKEIWETTLDIISHKAVNWRIVLAKSGVMDRSEIDFWTGLASAESSASVTLTLLTVKPRPSLQLLPHALPLSPTTLSTQSGMLTTPVSTPQALSILSPDYASISTPARDPIANAPTPDSTPIEPPPPDATLIDFTDQSWGSILSHRLNNSNSLLENNPALLSGYLIKRGGTRPEDTPILFEINIVGVSSEGHRNARAYEHLLKEIMSMYRGLGTLARVRGVVDPVKDARPWHVAAVEKAVKVLYTLM